MWIQRGTVTGDGGFEADGKLLGEVQKRVNQLAVLFVLRTLAARLHFPVRREGETCAAECSYLPPHAGIQPDASFEPAIAEVDDTPKLGNPCLDFSELPFRFLYIEWDRGRFFFDYWRAIVFIIIHYVPRKKLRGLDAPPGPTTRSKHNEAGRPLQRSLPFPGPGTLVNLAENFQGWRITAK